MRSKEVKAILDRYNRDCRIFARRYFEIARSVCGPVLSEEDLYAEARYAVLEAVGSYTHDKVAEPTWVRTRIKHRMIDCLRRFDTRTRDEVARMRTDPDAPESKALRQRKLVSLDAMFSDTGSYRIPTAHDTAEEAHLRSLLAVVRQAVAELPPRQRRAIELGYFEGLSLSEAAAVLNVSISRVCQLQKRGINRLREVFGHALN